MGDVVSFQEYHDIELAKKERRGVISSMNALLGRLIISIDNSNFQSQNRFLDEILGKKGLFEILYEYGEITLINNWITDLRKTLTINTKYHRKEELKELISYLENLVSTKYITDITQSKTNNILS